MTAKPAPRPKTAPDRGTRKDYTLTRLKKAAPELFESVKAGKLSANAAILKNGSPEERRAAAQTIGEMSLGMDYAALKQTVIGTSGAIQASYGQGMGAVNAQIRAGLGGGGYQGRDYSQPTYADIMRAWDRLGELNKVPVKKRDAEWQRAYNAMYALTGGDQQKLGFTTDGDYEYIKGVN
jgi:hypothetical protein